MTFGKKEEEIFLGRDFTKRVDYSETTAVQIDAEVRRLLMDAYERARMLLRRNLAALHRVAEALLERESLDGAEIDEILQSVGAPGPAAATA
jgi:cell division protease FtsH